MNPRAQIQEQAKIAADKVREAMNEFSEQTGVTAAIEIDWLKGNVRNVAGDVTIRVQGEFKG